MLKIIAKYNTVKYIDNFKQIKQKTNGLLNYLYEYKNNNIIIFLDEISKLYGDIPIYQDKLYIDKYIKYKCKYLKTHIKKYKELYKMFKPLKI